MLDNNVTWQCLLGEHLQNNMKKNKWSSCHFNRSKFEHTSEFYEFSKILKVYKLNIFNTTVFMYKI